MIGNGSRVEVTRDIARLAADWTDLESRAEATAFQSYAWCRAWADAAAAEAASPGRRWTEEPYIVTVRDGGRLVLLWPFVVRRLGPLRVLASFGEPATHYADALVEQGPDRYHWLALAWGKLTEGVGFDAVILRNMRGDAMVADLPALRSDRWVTSQGAAPTADFRPHNPFGPMKRRSSRTRNALNRKLRHLAQIDAVTFERVDDPGAREQLMQEALRFKHAWLRRRARFSAGYRHPANASFLMRLAARDDFLITRLKVGEETAAVEAGLLRRGWYWSLVQSYDERFAHHGPGHLLFWHVIEHAADLNIKVVDFLSPAMPHKREWANGEVPVRDLVVPLSPAGRVAVLYFRAVRPRLKSFASALSSLIALLT